MVSNHGGRQLDYSPSAIEMLPSVLKAVKGRIPVIVDGGIRRGTDVLKVCSVLQHAVDLQADRLRPSRQRRIVL